MAKKRRRSYHVPPTVAPVCPYCGTTAIHQASSAGVYSKNYGPLWVCGHYPQCDAYVGCHPGTDRPLGRLANAELRLAKRHAHAAFDPLWRGGPMRRHEAYEWLAGQLGLTREQCHVGEFDVEACKRVIEVCKSVPVL